LWFKQLGADCSDILLTNLLGARHAPELWGHGLLGRPSVQTVH